ncbi:hypothetical protein H112_01290 [Trichophyton rubrum D6]|uniref:Uncharacterized protein n=2 Tax=Trichophyton TaxID=5550 RepID=A0A022WDX4_TRIRU|nr:hypothetical protein H100_01285 [Trichophyton rubrum MR850]EZF45642.1 hypothetical protein H102_01280 [Trichophyton rubrum CBS 100081]EZF56288.1 hypothetical protein H103_01289 [Trichophyton rubrum CBS 288.86]EZF66908.1 hypothetical protein H104_01273 [Trichophyton rubrum CBS 289.86]EZF77556.1 hypothetical protein H105_01294 [Trichophyton soudanense CBS 452.61]EZF88201.1 hypothetical protein H110_01289 [Trichophyton rubrum MR1448]EZG20570.1 hypothetical protein H107_01338 [Trichophyton rub
MATTPKAERLKAQEGRNLSADVDGNLPSYTQSPSKDDQLPPETLLLAGGAIHSTSRPASCSTPLYKLSIDISFLRKNNTKVELSRCENRIHNRDTTGSPVGKGRLEWRVAGDGAHLLAYDTIDDGISRLNIIKSMPQNQRDALVGVWCLRIWREIANSNIEPVSWDGGM